MLDRVKLIEQISKNASLIANQQARQLDLAIQAWHKIVLEPENKFMGEFIDLKNQEHDNFVFNNYMIIACDGSQIYPDRHMGSNFYLINTGVVKIKYSNIVSESSSIELVSRPYFFANLGEVVGNIADYIDSKRHELEMQDGLQAVVDELGLNQKPIIYLIDGSLIAWHLFGKSESLCETFLPSYINQLKLCLANKIPVVGYVSLPNSTDLINLLKASQLLAAESQVLTGVVDSDLLANILPVGYMTGWFLSQASALKDYPTELKIYFAYLNTGYEIVRLEVPQFIFCDLELLNLNVQVIFDQIKKGFGYPVVLSEAHQQAVIKSQDRDFFYQVISQFSQAQKKPNQISHKLRHKQVMNF